MKTGSKRRSSPAFFFWVCFACVVFIVRLALPNGRINLFSRVYRSNPWWGYRLPLGGDIDNIGCNGSRVYMYDLPPKFNVGLYYDRKCNQSMIPWMDLCPRFRNGGYGLRLSELSDKGFNSDSEPQDEFDRSSWYDTDPYMLEVIFHHRMKTYPCLTGDPLTADAFFIPYYAGLHSLVHLFIDERFSDMSQTFEARKTFGTDLVAWLDEHGGQAWQRHRGDDHFLVLGRTTWDFKLFPRWGTGFSGLPQIANVTRLLMERNSFKRQEFGVPYATSFHPSSPEKLRDWIERVMRSERKYLFSYVGAPRTDSWSVRGIVSSSCVNAGESVCKLVNCTIVKCSHEPKSTYNAFLHSNFCLQPRGDSATRRSTFDCLIAGAIPVFFHHDSAYTQYPWHLPPDPESYSVYIPERDIREGISIQQVLADYSPARISEMRKTIVSIIPKLLYNGYANDPRGPSKDAFELSVARVLERIWAARNSPMNAQLKTRTRGDDISGRKEKDKHSR